MWIKDIEGSQSSKNQKSLQFIDFDHKKEKFDEDSKEERTSKIINIDEILASYEASMNLMSQQTMILLKNHNYIVSQLLNYKS